MRIHYPKLHNMTHALSLSVFIASKGFKFSILLDGVLNNATYGEIIRCSFKYV